MKATIINTGTELLLGNVVNTHLPYLAKQLFPLGLRIEHQVTVPDGDAIQEALQEAASHCDILIITGGLGPTSDDLTLDICANFLQLPLIHNSEIEEKLRERCRLRGYPLRERMLCQCRVPEGGLTLANDHGTAPGIYLPGDLESSPPRPHIFLLPGPPRELKPMFENYALPLLLEILPKEIVVNERIYRVIGLGESKVEEMIGLELDAIAELEVGYCARPNEVDLRLIAKQELLDEVHPRIVASLGDNIAGLGDTPLEDIVVQLLQETQSTLSTVESCSGGLLGHRITNVPGASTVFTHGFITYSNEAKAQLLDIPLDFINKHGAVSEAVATAMALGAQKSSGSSYALSLTGIAGPGGGSKEKPVGTVFIALADTEGKVTVEKNFFPHDRETFKNLATQNALDLLRRQILKDKN